MDIWTNINLVKQNIHIKDIKDIKESLSNYNNEMYESFISALKQKALDMIK